MEELVLSYHSLLLSEPGALQRVGLISCLRLYQAAVGSLFAAASTE
jgi:hypothetical protein